MKKLLLIFSLAIFPLNATSAQFLTENKPADMFNTDADVLVSPESQVNYSELRNALKEKKWRKANDLTQALILEATGQARQGWLNAQTTEKLSCWDLKTMDNLWREYSNNHFGFSVQLPIFLETGNRPGRLNNQDAYEKFGDQVGWRQDGDWIIFIGNLDYSLDSPPGHLPNPRAEYEIGGGRLEYVSLAQRMVECKIDQKTISNKILPKN